MRRSDILDCVKVSRKNMYQNIISYIYLIFYYVVKYPKNIHFIRFHKTHASTCKYVGESALKDM